MAALLILNKLEGLNWFSVQNGVQLSGNLYTVTLKQKKYIQHSSHSTLVKECRVKILIFIFVEVANYSKAYFILTFLIFCWFSIQVVNFCIPFPSILSNITRKKKRKKSVKGKELQGKEKTGVDKRKGSRQKEGEHIS